MIKQFQGLFVNWHGKNEAYLPVWYYHSDAEQKKCNKSSLKWQIVLSWLTDSGWFGKSLCHLLDSDVGMGMENQMQIQIGSNYGTTYHHTSVYLLFKLLFQAFMPLIGEDRTVDRVVFRSKPAPETAYFILMLLVLFTFSDRGSAG